MSYHISGPIHCPADATDQSPNALSGCSAETQLPRTSHLLYVCTGDNYHLWPSQLALSGIWYSGSCPRSTGILMVTKINYRDTVHNTIKCSCLMHRRQPPLMYVINLRIAIIIIIKDPTTNILMEFPNFQ